MIYAIVFSAIIYPIGAHWVFGGGFLQVGDWLGTGIVGMQDFAGSTAVHLIGATGALAALLLLGPRKGKYGARRQAAGDPGPQHAAVRARGADPVARLVRVQPGLDAERARRALRRDPDHHQPGRRRRRARRGRRRRRLKTGTIDIGMAGNGAIAALVAITAPSGYVELWAAPIIGAVAGVIVVLGVYWVDKYIDDPVGALSAHGMAGIWGTISCGIFTAPRLAQYNGFGDPDGGLWYSGSFDQLIAQVLGFLIAFTFVFVAQLRHLLGDQEGLRPSRHRGGGGRRAGHLRARHVWLPGAVHPAAGVPGRRGDCRRRPRLR